MPSTIDDLHELFWPSNIYEMDQEKYGRVLDGVLAKYDLARSDLLALSQAEGGLVMVTTEGVIWAKERGVFNKRLEVEGLVWFESLVDLRREQRQPRGRESWIILRGRNSTAELPWRTGGPV